MSLETFKLNPAQVLQDRTVSVSATLVNVGDRDLILYLGNNGRSLLQNYCQDLFTLESYGSTLKSQTRGVKQVKGRKLVLKPSEKLEANWKLRAGQVPTAHSCQLELERSYQYSVSAQQELQIKQSESITDAKTASSQTKRGLVQVELQLDKTRYLTGDTIYANVVLKNRGKGTADIKEVAVNYPQLTGSCDLPQTEKLVLAPKGSSKFRCTLSKDDLSVPSQMYRLSVDVRYKYDLKSKKDLKIIK